MIREQIFSFMSSSYGAWLMLSHAPPKRYFLPYAWCHQQLQIDPVLIILVGILKLIQLQTLTVGERITILLLIALHIHTK